jgi:hypothetical protein
VSLGNNPQGKPSFLTVQANAENDDEHPEKGVACGRREMERSSHFLADDPCPERGKFYGDQKST